MRRVVVPNGRNVAGFLQHGELHFRGTREAEAAQSREQFVVGHPLGLKRLVDDATLAHKGARLAPHEVPDACCASCS